MTIPTRREAAGLLHSLQAPEWFLRHSCAVADVGAWLAGEARARGRSVDVDLVAVAALLHDVDKLSAVTVPGHLRHGEGSAAWLAGRGWPELGPLVEGHPVTRMADPGYPSWAASASLEARIVAYADKRAGQRLEAMDDRFASWRRRYPSGPSGNAPAGGWDDSVVALVRARAGDLEREACAAAGVRPEDVRRRRWSRRALREHSE